VHPDAVATVLFLDGMTFVWLGVDDELELELLLDELEPADGRQGGTIRVLTLLLAGRTS
jgi:hypothetical protein